MPLEFHPRHIVDIPWLKFKGNLGAQQINCFLVFVGELFPGKH